MGGRKKTRKVEPEVRAPGRVAGCLRRLAGASVVGLVGLGAVAVVVGIVAALAYHRAVVTDPGQHLDREHIRAIIAEESPVTFRDGVTPVGVFFTSEHRQFVPFELLPRAYVMGIVASEDDAFWSHPGISAWGILRAVRDNLVAGDVVSGGSTLTQQTAKNLYYRPDRSVRSKLVEFLNALRLEAHYDKSEILEFYVNQFHVTGNGRGLGIAARHFFDEDVASLTTVESAFLAGLVKAPAWYDPFLGDESRREQAIARAETRTVYVLRRIVEEPAEKLAGPYPVSGDPASRAAYEARVKEAKRVQEEARAALHAGVKLTFKRGAFRYDSSAVLDEVARRLSEPPLSTLLESQGITDAGKAGLVVVTTLDRAAQHEATYALWHHLTEVGAWLEAPAATRFVLAPDRAPPFDPDFPPHTHEFRTARVASHADEGGRHLVLDLGGHPCTVDRDGVVRVAVAAHRGEKKDRDVKAPAAVVDAFADAIPDGAVVLVSVRDADKRLCDLELRPELQGAAVVLQDGLVRAMVGGNDNRNFNRATALRQYGSTWKPIVYHAALQLGWLPDDVLDNTRNVFPFSSTFYYPSPDHDPLPRVSMSFAGVSSENLASVWLLYHLLDRLDGEQVKSLAGTLDLLARTDETPEAYRRRIQDAGVLPVPSRVPEGHFLQARQEVLVGLPFGAHPEDEVALRSMSWGWGYASERTRVAREGPQTRALKEKALDAAWPSFSTRTQTCEIGYGALATAFEARRTPDPTLVPGLWVKRVDGEPVRIEVACALADEERPGWLVADEPWSRPDQAFVDALWPPDTVEPGAEEPLGRPKKPRMWPFGRPDPVEPEPPSAELAALDDLLVDGRMHVATVRAVEAALARREMAWELRDDKPDLYDPNVIIWHQDFRVLVAMRYVAALAERYGVQTDLREVVSMPLGASEITLEEAASVYQGLVSGQAWRLGGRGPRGLVVDEVPTPTVLIAEIRDVDGNVLYRAKPEPVTVADREAAAMTADVLRNVVRFGTGRRAEGAVRVGGMRVPLGGKTGTTNDFRNAAFLGFAPGSDPLGYDPAKGCAVGVYVGYDDNRPLVSGRIKLSGASGALPAWIGVVEGLAAGGLLGEAPARANAPDGKWPMVWPAGLTSVAVAEGSGLPSGAELVAESPSVLTRTTPRDVDVDFEFVDRPARIAPTTQDATTPPLDGP